ncbi:potassium channel subfamily K member 6-like isoform X2 [Biomphalaria glabrata]|uniref:Potassium channel subfamily K member 1 n=2 Tax=Biomphalaria TaxID=6525 RepID=A0A9W2ZV38_BIOGL|nr:potassium channel subfamily K member 6-like isoform X2 [Biomphalaria glabrata]XP_055878862.1 potassium channel subfamily K member 6-like isoform X2 [Biomphalaria glabrata]XP_055878863.1 potassium channel subfamily K member 6-like isoform X2 [Biomphalaria glabrata]
MTRKKLTWCATHPLCRLFTHVAIFFGYLCGGAAIFMHLESPREEALVNSLKTHRFNFLANNSCVSDEELEKFIQEIVQGANRGVSAVKNVSQSEPNWSFGQALFFASTVVTTIGYGRVTPLSEAGKAFCILFAIMGIPLTLVLFTACVERLMIPTRNLLYWLYGKLGHLYKVFHIQVLHLCIILGIHIIFFMLIPAAIYTVLEPNWNYLDAFYYCFISLSTIGLGDYIPGDSADQPHRALYKVATTFYLLLGITMLLLLITVFYDIPELNLGYHFYLKNDENNRADENTRLKPSESGNSTKYTKQVDDTQSIRSGEFHSYQQDVQTPVTEEEQQH